MALFWRLVVDSIIKAKNIYYYAGNSPTMGARVSSCLDSETFSTVVFGKHANQNANDNYEELLLKDNERHDIESVLVKRNDSRPVPSSPALAEGAPVCVVAA